MTRQCPATGKQQLDRKTAQRLAGRWRRTRRVKRMDHYRCDACRHWHIGKVPLSVYRAAKETA